MSMEIKPQRTEEQAEIIRAAMPKELLMKHQNLSAMQEAAMWGSGEFSLDLQERFHPEYSKAAIRKVVADIYHIASGTVRDRERVAATVTKEMRERLPFLKFHHWRNIIPASKEKAKSILWQAAMMWEHEGKGPSVDQILAWRNVESIDATPVWIFRLTAGLDKMEMVRDDPMADPVIRQLFGETIQKVERRAAEIKLERFELGDGRNGND